MIKPNNQMAKNSPPKQIREKSSRSLYEEALKVFNITVFKGLFSPKTQITYVNND
jgi:hypothetical protein